VIRLIASERRRSKQVDRLLVCGANSFKTRLALPYSWKQTLEDVDVVVPVPKGTRSRDLVVVIKKKKLTVGLKGKDPLMAGDLCQDIKVEESTWTLG
jgi:hypothetical protein